jgi:hypothetical protein
MLRIAYWTCLLAAFFMFAPEAKASQICENVVVGQTPPQIIGYENNNNNKPIYGPPQPIYQEQCYWKYGAVAIDPATRAVTSAWNYDDLNVARDYVVGQCGKHCTWIAFGEDFAYIALSDDDRISATSAKSSADAEAQCTMAGGTDCSTVVAASSTANSSYWHFGSIAYDSVTGASGAAWNYLRRGEARAASLQSCANAGCWAFAFQTGYGGMALADDGNLFGAWSARSEEGAGKAALKDCEKAKGKKTCSIVYTGSARGAPEYKPKVKKKKQEKEKK